MQFYSDIDSDDTAAASARSSSSYRFSCSSTATRLRLLSVLVSLVCVGLLLICLTLPRVYSTSLRNTRGDYSSLLRTIGPFTANAWPEGGHVCTLGEECNCSFVVYDFYPEDRDFSFTISLCRVWNANRSILVLAGVFAVLAVGLHIVALCTSKSFILLAGIIFPLLGSICGVVSMSLFLYSRDHDSTLKSQHSTNEYGTETYTSTELDYGFWCLVGAWLGLLVTAALLARSQRKTH